MLGRLFGSKTRVKILKLFLSHPDEKFYIRQIARDLKLQLNSVRRELENLQEFGLLVSGQAALDEHKAIGITREQYIKNIAALKKSEKKHTKTAPKLDKKYYRANKNFILYDEIRALIIKAQILYEKDFIEKLNKTGQPKLLILTGYFVNQPNQGIDLFIVGRLNKTRFKRLIKELENDIGREINYTLMGSQEFKYRRDITDIFLYDILEGNKLVVIDNIGLS